jgi:tetraacyldisaccharide 4'-kinase
LIARLAARVWTGAGVASRVARGVLAPLEAVYGVAVATRGALYDRGVLPSRLLPMPSVSVGNLTVGGTGKTPVAAWLVAELARCGSRPAVLLRDYGRDEALVHRVLNPGIPVVASANRIEAARRARALGADVAVLDDAFQHRRARRDADVVLLSADAWGTPGRLLPAGPWREPLSSLRRASLVIVTYKAASQDGLAAAWDGAGERAPGVPRAVARLAPAGLAAANGAEVRELPTLSGARVLAVAGIADPRSFARQLETLGAAVRLRAFPDHHAFVPRDALAIAREADNAQLVICTLKDAVKLAPLWPAAAPALWYLRQRVILERGHDEVDRLVGALVAARTRYLRTAG